MLNNINIKINGLSDKVSLDVVNSLRNLIQHFSFLDFRRFHNIIITSNFERDIEILTSNNRLSFKNRYRANRDTYAVVLTIPKDNDFELFLVMKTEFTKNILENHQKQEYKNALHILHHELAHVHDNNKKIDVFKDLMKTKSYKGTSSITYPIAETCWSEYIANFISSSSAIDTDYPKIIANSLVQKIIKTEQNIKTELMAYRINKKREDLLKSSISQIESLLKSASYLIGYLNGMNLTLEELDDKLDYEIEISYFKDIWEVLKYEFATIHQVYPHGFININVYKDLAYYIEVFFSQMGIVLDENENDQLKIHIM